MDLDEPDTVSEQESAVSIKDAFLRLIETNKDLHNKVLTYEPLPLESLHSTLKLNGLKCKLNALMDFLDEQVSTKFIICLHIRSKIIKIFVCWFYYLVYNISSAIWQRKSGEKEKMKQDTNVLLQIHKNKFIPTLSSRLIM